MTRRLVLALLLLELSAFCARKPVKTRGPEPDLTRPPAEWLEMEPVRLLHEYVRLDTTEGKGELSGALFLKRLFDCEGIESEIVCPAPARCNLLARLPGRKREGGLLLLNHIDVAEPYAAYWKEAPPFEGRIKLGYLYGRGAYDMKSIAIAEALAMRDVKRHGVVPPSDLLFLAEADEESTQEWGSAWLLAHRADWFRGVSVVLNEGGTNEMLLRDVRFWGIETVQAGYASGEFEASSEASLAALAARWPHLRSTPVLPQPDVVLGFDMLANHLTPPLTDSLRHLDRVLRNPEELAQLPDRYGCFLEARVFWGTPYAFPPESRTTYRSYVLVSTPPGVDPGTFLDPILRDAAASGVRLVHSFTSGPSLASPYATPFVGLLRRATEAHHPGVPFGPVPTFGGYTTSARFRQKGFLAYGYSPIPANITDSARRHGLDERIYLRDYVEGVSLYRDAIADWASGQ